jgi:hypothetical protein
MEESKLERQAQLTAQLCLPERLMTCAFTQWASKTHSEPTNDVRLILAAMQLYYLVCCCIFLPSMDAGNACPWRRRCTANHLILYTPKAALLGGAYGPHHTTVLFG